jgi:uncharacterized protein (DUF58 family)
MELDGHPEKAQDDTEAQQYFPLKRRPSVTRNWINLSVLLILMGLFLQDYAIFVLPVLLLVTIAAASWWNSRVLRQVTYECAMTRTRAFPGETVEIDIQVENAKALPVPWLRVEDDWPVELPVSEIGAPGITPSSTTSLTNVYSLRWYERVHRHYIVRAEQRGVFRLGPAHLRAGDVFGLFHNDRVLGSHARLTVYPRVLPLEELGLPPKEPLGDTRARYQLIEDPSRTMGARDFRPGDSFRHIHWPATARRQTLQTRVYEPTATLTAVICLNVATLAKPWQGILPDLLEDTIVMAASLAAYAAENRYAIGLIANGAVPRSDRSIRVMPGRAPNQLMHILELLAAVSGFATASMDKFLLNESPALPWGATLVVITGVITPELLATLRQLQSAGRRIVLISMGVEPPPQLPGVLIHHIPSKHAPYYSPEEAGDMSAISKGVWR